MPSPAETFRSVAFGWLADTDSDVVHVEEVDGRWAVRIVQPVREATTIWWEIGRRSIVAEAMVIPEPVVDPAGAYRLCLVRNDSTWWARFAVDREGAVVVRSRIPLEEADADRLDAVLGEIVDLVEVSFGPLVRLGFGREKTP